MQESTFLLPIAVVSPMDIARLVRELKNLEEYFAQNAIRTGETPEVPRYSRLLDSIVVINKLDLVDQDQRGDLMQRFVSMQDSAPVMHISFSVDPPGAYVQKIVAWLRENIDPLVLVRVGLQPNIGAGCIVRTTNKAFDFSLRQYFDQKQDFFVSRLHDVLAENSNEPQEAVEAEVPAEDTVQSEDEVQPEIAEDSSDETSTATPEEDASDEAEQDTEQESEAVSVPVEVKS